MKVMMMSIIMVLSLSAKEIYLVEDPWPPFTYGKLSFAPEKGAVVDALKQIFQQHDLKLKLYPWKRAIQMAKEGKADGLMLTLATKKREEFFAFSKPLFTQNIYFITQSDRDITYRGLSSLKEYTIATVLGSKYSDAFQKAIKEVPLKIEAAARVGSNIKKLLSGRVDVMIASDLTFCSALEPDVNPKDFKLLKPAFVTKEFRIALSKKSQTLSLLPMINAKIDQLHKSGQIHTIQNQYFSPCLK